MPRNEDQTYDMPLVSSTEMTAMPWRPSKPSSGYQAPKPVGIKMPKAGKTMDAYSFGTALKSTKPEEVH